MQLRGWQVGVVFVAIIVVCAGVLYVLADTLALQDASAPPNPVVTVDTRTPGTTTTTIEETPLETSNVTEAAPAPTDVFHFGRNEGSSISILSYDPVSKHEALVGDIQTFTVISDLLSWNGKLFFWAYSDPSWLGVLTDSAMGFDIVLSIDPGRHIVDGRVLGDGMFMISTADYEADTARDSKIELYKGETRVASFAISSTSPKYAAVGIVGVDEQRHVAYLREGGGDAGYAWGSFYSLNYETGALENLGKYSIGENETTGYFVDSINQSGTVGVAVEDTKIQSPTVKILVRDLEAGTVTTFDTGLATGLTGYISGWLDDERVIVRASDAAYTCNIDTRQCVDFPIAVNDRAPAPSELFVSSQGGYALMDSAFVGPRAVAVVDARTMDWTDRKEIPWESPYPGEMRFITVR